MTKIKYYGKTFRFGPHVDQRTARRLIAEVHPTKLVKITEGPDKNFRDGRFISNPQQLSPFLGL